MTMRDQQNEWTRAGWAGKCGWLAIWAAMLLVSGLPVLLGGCVLDEAMPGVPKCREKSDWFWGGAEGKVVECWDVVQE